MGLLALGIFSAGMYAYAQSANTNGVKKNIVYVAPIKGVIDLGLAPFVERVLDEALKNQAAAVISTSTPLVAE